jgi:hypothetical protein
MGEMKMKTINFYVLPKRPGYVRTLQVDENAPLSDALAEIEKDVPLWQGKRFYLKVGKKAVGYASIKKSLTEIFDGQIPDNFSITRCDARTFSPVEMQKLRNLLDDVHDFMAMLVAE